MSTSTKNIIMSASQARASCGVKNFNFPERFGFEPYSDPDAPAVFYGVYNAEDLQAVMSHRGPAVVRWCGIDAKNHDPETLAAIPPNVRHIANNDLLRAELAKRGIMAAPLKWGSSPVEPRPQRLGNKLYYYALKKHPKYGFEAYEQIMHDYPINLITELLADIDAWKAGLADHYYSETCLGLALSDFVGGAGGVKEMGIRGIPVITNITDLPNCIPWKTAADIERIMEERMQDAGKDTTALAQETAAAINSQTWIYKRGTQ